MLTIEDEIQILLSLLPAIEDDHEYADIAKRILELNIELKGHK